MVHTELIQFGVSLNQKINVVLTFLSIRIRMATISSKAANGDPYHEFHESREHIRMPSKLVEDKESTIVQDINSAEL